MIDKMVVVSMLLPDQLEESLRLLKLRKKRRLTIVIRRMMKLKRRRRKRMITPLGITSMGHLSLPPTIEREARSLSLRI